MPSALPDGEPAPADGALPASSLSHLGERPFGIYVHIPFCAVRCGYCDFNTYTALELGGGASQAAYADTASRELDLAAQVLSRGPASGPPVDTVFFGGGTPTLLPAAELVGLLDTIRERFGLAPGAEVSTEANPDSVTPQSLGALAAGGVNRVSFGMQSAVPHVLATLDRTHDPERVPLAVQWARDAGLAVSLDLIYGTPGESLADWAVSLEAAVACAPDHLSAYALVVEPGTRLAARVARGEVPAPDDDDEAAKYELADEVLTRNGLGWYEISNWARTPGDVCRHNVGYWTDGDWWGVGPGAHSHVGGVRWWNVKHPSTYAARVAAGASPAQARELLTAEQRLDERVLLGVRLRQGLAVEDLPDRGRLAGPIAHGLVDGAQAIGGRAVLTLRGRLLADTVVRALAG
ncbi:MAG: radical SAM family heme chaperone HemW [Actinomycetota bacterium]|nr:radical SAM family heme chaperone HemW [Actinomycetota bacterium]